MKIGITCYPTYGGSGAVATELGLALAKRGHEVHFISYAQPFRLDRFQEGVFFHEVEMDDYPLFEHPPYSLALAVAIHDVAEGRGLDLVHVHYAIPHATSAWIAKEMGGGKDLRVLTTLHGTDITLVGQHPSFKSITRFSVLRSDGISAVSEYLRNETETQFGVEPGRIEVIPNFVDVARYRPGIRPDLRDRLAERGERILMHISNFRAVKRVPDAVTAFAEVARVLPSRLILIGDGPERPVALRQAQQLGVEDRVTFLGKLAAVEELLSCADLFLLPSESESFGLAALEAMACGVPVVGTRVGGLPEVIPAEAGILLPVGAAREMGEAALALLSDSNVWERASRAARDVAVSRYSIDKVLPAYESWYRRVLDSQPERSS
jgi:N-acetyl-alpha-D-glucosaminyl L-malate synthase BshA